MKKWLMLGIMLIATACEKQVSWTLQSSDKQLIVVDGMLTDENKVQSVSLMYPVSAQNEAPRPVTGATVSITDGTTTWNMKENGTLNGIYYTDTTMVGVPGKTYTLNISSYGTNYSATDKMLPVEWFSQLRYAKGSNNLYHITWVSNAYNPGTAAMYEVLLDWSHVPGYTKLNPADCKATLYYFSLTTIDVSEIFQPEIEKIDFPAGTIINERKYSLSPAYENFIRCFLLETKWRGGLFDSTPANLPTNLSDGAVGYFSTGSVVSLSITVGP